MTVSFGLEWFWIAGVVGTMAIAWLICVLDKLSGRTNFLLDIFKEFPELREPLGLERWAHIDGEDLDAMGGKLRRMRKAESAKRVQDAELKDLKALREALGRATG